MQSNKYICLKITTHQILFLKLKRRKSEGSIKSSWCSNSTTSQRWDPELEQHSRSKLPLSALEFKDTALSWLWASSSVKPLHTVSIKAPQGPLHLLSPWGQVMYRVQLPSIHWGFPNLHRRCTWLSLHIRVHTLKCFFHVTMDAPKLPRARSICLVYSLLKFKHL